MPKLKCETRSKHPAADAFAKVKTLLETDSQLRSMDPSYRCAFDDSAMKGTAKGGKFDASLTVSADGAGGCEVVIEVNLPLLLTPLKGVVQSTLQKKMDAALA